MGLNFKSWLLGMALLQAGSSFANAPRNFLDTNYLTVKRMVVKEVSIDFLNQQKSSVVFDYDYYNNYPGEIGQPDPIDYAGKVISVAKDLVALGEDVYQLVIKGKPSNSTKYSPISVIPRGEDGGPVDIMETENWQMPVKRSFEVLYENLYGMEVVKFRYSIIYSYGGSYDGRGAYLTSVQIIPESVNTLFGYDFTATMKLGGIQNMGTRSRPVAGATVLLEYTVKTVMKANNEVRTFFVTGKGDFKKY